MTSPLSPEAVAQMVARLHGVKNTTLPMGAVWYLCNSAADMLTTLAAENATLRTDLAETEALEMQHGAVIERLTTELATLRASEAAAMERSKVLTEAAAHVLHDIDDLVANSEGVTGLHQNGDVAEWADILDGGSFEAWLRSVETLREALTPTADKE